MDEQQSERLLQLLERLAIGIETLARGSAPAELNYQRPLPEYKTFDWSSIGASVVQADQDGPTHVEQGGFLWTRRSPSNRFDPAIWFSRANGRDADGNVEYLRLITFKPVKEAERLPEKAAQALSQPGAPAPEQKKTPTGQLQVQRPYPPDYLKAKLNKRAEAISTLHCSQEQRNLAAMMLAKPFAGEGAEDKRHKVQKYLFGADSLKDVSEALILVVLNDWMKPAKDNGGDYQPDALAVKEAQLVYREALKAEGQLEMF